MVLHTECDWQGSASSSQRALHVHDAVCAAVIVDWQGSSSLADCDATGRTDRKTEERPKYDDSQKTPSSRTKLKDPEGKQEAEKEVQLL